MSLFKFFYFGKLIRSGRSATLKVFLAGSLGLLSFSNFDSFAQGNLLVTPKRVVFEGSTKSLDINLANSGQDSATYVISLIQVRMKADGGFETISEPDPGQKFADRYIRFFPRSVTLGPKEAQVVKVQIIRTNELVPGEYRSHFYFRAVPKITALGDEEEVKDTTSISVKLIPVFGITIPVIIRSGETTVKVTISDMALANVNDTVPRLSLVFNRTGNISVYGDLSVDHISPQGIITRVGSANGVAVYTPNVIRRFQFNLNKANGIDFSSGKLLVTYSAPSDVKPVKFTEAELNLN
jgi:hypothetical protein